MNIYYHFFDRELRESVNANLTDSYIQKIITVSLLISNGICYVPISNLYESYFDFPNAIRYLNHLNKLGFVKLASSHDKVENFLFSRRSLYTHDQGRYPMYFGQDINVWSDDLIVLEESTTKILRNRISSNGINIKEMDRNQNAHLNESISSIIKENEKSALTFSLFKSKSLLSSFSDKDNDVAHGEIRKSISINYTQRYLDVLDGHIITGINSICFYDYLEKKHFSTNFSIIYFIFKNAGIDLDSSDIVQLILLLKKNNYLFSIGYNYLKNFLNILDLEYTKNNFNKSILNANKCYPRIKDEGCIVFNLVSYLEDISNKYPKLKEGMLQMYTETETIAIIAVTNTEMKSLIKTIKKTLKQIIIVDRVIEKPQKLVYYEILGYNKRIALIQSGMGLSGQNGIINILNNVFACLNPTTVLMVGIAFGANPEKQKIGDILVSKQVWNYEPSKLQEDKIIPRGDKISASTFLLQLFQTVELDFEVPVHFGLIASGEKLINSVEKLRELIDLEPEIIGGDMEAAGLATVCTDKKADWLVIKAICDWGTGKTDDYQNQAADNACAFLLKGILKIIN